MLYIALAFFLGDVGLQCSPSLPNARDALCVWSPALLSTIILLCLIARRYPFSRYVLAFCLGFTWAGVHGWLQLQQDLRPELEGRDITVVGYIGSIPEHEPYGSRFNFVIESNVTQLRLPRNVELSWYSRTQQLHAAERWQLQVRLKRRHGFANPGGVDYEAQLFRQGIGATGYVRESSDTRLLGLANGEYILRARAALVERIANAIPEAPMQGVVRGLAVGDQQAITGEQWQVFARTGISHLIAISGSHIGMVGLLAAWLGGFLVHWRAAQRLRLTRPDLRAIFGMSAASAYSLLAGMSVPTQRTLITLAVYFAAQWLRRYLNVWHSFGLALLLCLLVDPFAPLAIGTWLSFGAIAVIVLNQQGRLRRDVWWREFLSLQLVVSIGLLPLLIAAFGNVSLIAPVVNLIAIPLFTVFLVPAVLISCAALLIYSPLGMWCLHYVALALNATFSWLKWSADLPLATWYLPQAPLWALLLLGLGAFIVVLPLFWPLRACGLLCCLPAALWTPAPLPPNSFELTTLDVGQGLATVIRTGAHVLVYDTGPKFQSGNDTGLLVVLPYLHAMGVRHVDVMMISHGDDDHAGGLESVAAGIRVNALLFGPSVRSPLAAIQRCRQGQQWQWDGIQFEVLHPSVDDTNAGDNNTSCVLRVSGPGGSALLLGDAEKPVEAMLVASGQIYATDIVVAGHHGSRSSSTPALVNAVQAREVLFSAGYRNRWGFPKSDVVQRWQAAGARTDSTIESGALTVRVTADGMHVPQVYRQTRRRYWQTQ